MPAVCPTNHVRNVPQELQNQTMPYFKSTGQASTRKPVLKPAAKVAFGRKALPPPSVAKPKIKPSPASKSKGALQAKKVVTTTTTRPSENTTFAEEPEKVTAAEPLKAVQYDFSAQMVSPERVPAETSLSPHKATATGQPGALAASCNVNAEAATSSISPTTRKKKETTEPEDLYWPFGMPGGGAPSRSYGHAVNTVTASPESKPPSKKTPSQGDTQPTVDYPGSTSPLICELDDLGRERNSRFPDIGHRRRSFITTQRKLPREPESYWRDLHEQSERKLRKEQREQELMERLEREDNERVLREQEELKHKFELEMRRKEEKKKMAVVSSAKARSLASQMEILKETGIERHHQNIPRTPPMAASAKTPKSKYPPLRISHKSKSDGRPVIQGASLKTEPSKPSRDVRQIERDRRGAQQDVGSSHPAMKPSRIPVLVHKQPRRKYDSTITVSKPKLLSPAGQKCDDGAGIYAEIDPGIGESPFGDFRGVELEVVTESGSEHSHQDEIPNVTTFYFPVSPDSMDSQHSLTLPPIHTKLGIEAKDVELADDQHKATQQLEEIRRELAAIKVDASHKVERDLKSAECFFRKKRRDLLKG